MKKLRVVVRVSTAILMILAIVGVILLVTDENSAHTTSYEIIAFIVGIAGMIMAVVSQIDSAQQEKLVNRIAQNISEDLKVDEQTLELLKNHSKPKKA